MSLRQLKFKPKFPVCKVKKNEEPTTEEVVADTKEIDTSSSLACIENSATDQKFPASQISTNKQDNVTNSKSEISNNNANDSDVVEATLKTNDVIGKTVLPSLRQLKCKPKLNSLSTRASNKVVTTGNHQEVPKHDIGIVESARSLSGEEPSTIKPLSASSEFDRIKENILEKLISKRSQNVASELKKTNTCEASTGSKGIPEHNSHVFNESHDNLGSSKEIPAPEKNESPKNENVSKKIDTTSGTKSLSTPSKFVSIGQKPIETENDSDVLQTSAACGESTEGKGQLPEHNFRVLNQINDDIKSSKEILISEKKKCPKSEDVSHDIDTASATKSSSTPSKLVPVGQKPSEIENDSDVLQTSAACEESLIDKDQLPEHNSLLLNETNEDLRTTKEIPVSEKNNCPKNENISKTIDLSEKSPIVLNIGIKTHLSSPITQLDNQAKEDANSSEKLEKSQSEEKKTNQGENEGNLVKNEVICRHLLPIRQINLPPKLRRPWLQNKIFKNNSSLIKNVDNVNKSEDSEKKEISPEPVIKNNIAEESIPESKELKSSTIDNISNSLHLKDNSKNSKDCSKKIKSCVKKDSKSVNKPLKSIKNTHANSKKNETSPSDAEVLIKNSNEPLKEKTCVTHKCINNSSKKKEAKNRAVYGSKSIRSCHLGIPFKPKLTNRSNKPFASSTFGKMCYEAKAQFEKKFKDEEPDSTKLTMLDLIFYNPSSNPMPQEEKKLKTAPVNNTKNIDVPDETPDSEVTDQKNKNTDSNDVPVPQLKLSSDGKVIIAQESLVVEQSLGEISDNIEEITTEKFKKKKNNSEEGCRAGWSHIETLKFYKALNSLGSDFETMKSMFPGRSRSNLKSKFKREERLHGKLIDKIMTHPSEFNLQKATEELKRCIEEKETDDLYEETIKTLGRNLKIKKVTNKEIKERHHLILENAMWPKRKRKKPQKIEQTPSDLDKDGDECPIPIRRKMPKRNRNSANTTQHVINTSDKNNIVISTNIEYDHLKLTQFITYNSNNLDNPIEVNTTIAHDSKSPVCEVLDETLDQ